MEMITGFDCSKTADTACDAYKKVVDCTKNVFGDIPVIPYVMMAGTDSRHYTKICNCVLRFAPIIITPQQQATAHATNENIDISSLARAVVYFVNLIKNYD